MSKHHAHPEYMMFGSKNVDGLDEYFQRAAFLEDLAQGITRTQSESNPRNDGTRVDALVDRFRLNQEA